MTLSIIIINYNSYYLSENCINSILEIKSNIELEIIVIDNSELIVQFSEIFYSNNKIQFIKNKKNIGFGRANNIGIEKAKGDYILFLNSDVFVNENTINECLNILQNNPQIGALGCKLIYPDGSAQKSVYYYIAENEALLKENILYYKFFYKQPKEIKAVMGAFMMVPKKVLVKTGGFDPDFFLYAEEIELCYRIQKAGFQIALTDNTQATHIHGASSENKTWARRQNLLSTSLLFLKVRGKTGYFIYHFLTIINFTTNFLLLWRTDKNYRKNYWQQLADYFSNFRYYLVIPFKYSKQFGSGKSFLKRDY